MELGLSLGDSTASSKPKRPRAGVVGLGFCMALGINSNGLRPYDLQKSNEENNDDDDNSSSEDTIRDDDIDQRLHLHLLPPSINYRSQISLRCSSDNGSSDNASSGNVHGKENGLNNSNSRKKLRLSKEQSAHLEDSFKEHNTLNPKQKLALAKQLNLRPRQIEVWFQNRRARTKLKQTEVDCEYLKRCCETLREENRRIQKELGELRALNTSNPFYMQLPATTLAMCPSCERVATTTSTPLPSTAAAATIAILSSTSATATAATDCIPTAIPFPISRPGLYPFCHTTNQSPSSK